MTNSIDINDFQQVSNSSAGSVSKVGWKPEEGASRQKQIEEARQQEWEAYQERKAMEDPNVIRLLSLEAAVWELQKQVKELQNAR